MEANDKKVTIALVGGGGANMAVLRILHKQPVEVKARLDVVIIDSQDYHQGGSSLQRLLIHTEKVPFATPSFVESQQHFGSWTRFVHGYVTAISAKNKVLLSDGTKVKFDYAVVATGSDYFSHPWLNQHTAALLDTNKKSPLAKAFKSDLTNEETQLFNSFEIISDLPGVEWAIVSDFLATAKSEAGLLRLHAALSDPEEYESTINKLVKKSKSVKKFLKQAKHEADAIAENASLIRDSIADKLRETSRLWGSRGLFRETVSDGILRTRQWRRDQINLEAQSIARADSILVLGGGEVSLETASDIIERYPNKKVTILHSGPELLERTKSSRAHKNINSFFKKRGVEVILNDSLKAWRPIGSKFAVETTSGKVLSFSKIIVGFGTRPRNLAFKHDFAENIDEVTGRITVDPFLRLNDKIFVLGDVGSGDRMNNFAANVQGELTAKNLVASIQGKSLTKYSKGPNVILICLGHTMCILVVGDTCIIAGTAPFGTKDSAEAKIMKGTGSMVDIDKMWSKEFAKLTKASVSSSSINS